MVGMLLAIWICAMGTGAATAGGAWTENAEIAIALEIAMRQMAWNDFILLCSVCMDSNVM